jgi:hypothetical protein
MRSRWSAGLVVLLAICLTGACTGEEPRRRHVDGEACTFDVARPRNGDVPIALDGVSTDDVWAVGAHYEGGAGVPYARRWDGETWDQTPVEVVADANAGFHDVLAVSRRDAWAVGSLRGREPMAQRWDGSSWSSVPIASFGGDEGELDGVATAGDRLLAVGRTRVGLRWRALAMTWERGSWVAQRVPSPGGVDAAFRSVAAAGPDDAWAVGWTTAPGGRMRTLAMRWDGNRWSHVATPDPGDGDHVLSSVAVEGPDDAWAVGWSIGADGIDRPLVLRWDGKRWGAAEPPTFDGRAQLLDVSAPRADDAWAAGRVTDATGTFRALVLRWDGRRWSEIPTPDVGADDDTLAGIAVIDGFPWAAGTSVDAEGRYTSLTLAGC